MRRTAFLAGVLCLSAIAGCRRTGPQQVTVRFWNGFTGPDGRTMLRLVQRFNRENPDVRVVMQRMDWETHYNKLFVAGMGHRAPELFVIHTHALDRFSRSGFVRPIDDLIASSGFDIKDVDPNVWRAAQFGGKHYGLPLDVHAMGMYYNRRMFREAGIVDANGQARPPTTRAEFLDAIRRLNRKGKRGEPDQWGFVFTNLESNIYTIMCQYGGKFFTADGSRCIINSPQNVAALEFCADLVKTGVVLSPENIDAWIGFRQGRMGMAFEGVYMLADLQKQKDLDFAGAPTPLIGTIPATWTGSHNLCMRGDLKGRELQATWRFMRFLSDNSLDWAAGGQIPVRRSLRNTPRFRQMAVQAQFARQTKIVRYLPRVPFIFEFQREFGTAIEAALRGTVTPQQALDTATANLNKVIARERRIAGTQGVAR